MPDRPYSWQTTYPALATVMEANYSTLTTWVESLPEPANDVERTVLRRLMLRRNELGLKELRVQAPEVADKLEELKAKLASIGFKVPTGERHG